ncbi:ROK family protein [Xylanimonas protaetiae]|uniref:ROK family protein n=1 Tax=Xylanimonas protaetiae TaxID=2509457 RepID=A0A4V0YFS7_9MICO|nr:ROK family protein [Xylanimonas protaetiae]QAY68751.1 ROK family protein [Xylanimonas protaetiae]
MTVATGPQVDLDIGGTWFRARVANNSGAEPFETVLPAPSLLRRPDRHVGDLIADLVDLLDRSAPPGADVAVSLGAAMDETTGVVRGSGPLWGDWTGQLPLADLLRKRRPDARWAIFNDLTCGVASLAASAPAEAAQITYMTVSSGVALRTADRTRGVIEVDRWGLQGEVGHGPAAPVDRQILQHWPLPCECGGLGHVASLASGPGLSRAAHALGLGPAKDFAQRFPSLLDLGDPLAQTLLTEAVRPVAEAIRGLWRVRPHAELVAVGGGVASGLGRRYERELRRLLVEDRTYADGGRDHAWVAEHVWVTSDTDLDLRAGARLLANHVLRPLRPGGDHHVNHNQGDAR